MVKLKEQRINVDVERNTPYTARPFVGVCGVQNTSELRPLEGYAKKYLSGTGYFLMAGVKNAHADIQDSYRSELVRPFVHCDFSAIEPFEQTIEHNLKACKYFAQGLQLNVLPWMEVDYAPLWKRLKRLYPDLLLMLQVPRVMMNTYSPQQIANTLSGLSIDYILFDPSQSQGKLYDLVSMREYVDAVHKRCSSIGIVVAGGLEGSVMPTIFQPLEKQYPGLSCDAFCRLNDPQTHRLSWPAVDAYLRAWRQL